MPTKPNQRRQRVSSASNDLPWRLDVAALGRAAFNAAKPCVLILSVDSGEGKYEGRRMKDESEPVRL